MALHGRSFEYSGFVLRAKANRDLLEREGAVVYAVSRRGFAYRLGFHYRPLARTGEGVEILPTSDGRRLRIQSFSDDLVAGSLDLVAKRNGQTRIEGWAGDIGRGERARQIVIYRDNHFLTNLGLGGDRPDIAETYGNEGLLHTGFGGAVPGAPDPADFARNHRVFAVMLRGLAVELPISP